MSRPIVAVFGSSMTRPGSAEYDAGVRCGSLLAHAGFDVATGGYDGLMAAVSQGAAASSAAVIGVTAPEVFPGREGANRFVTEERPHPTLTERIHDIMELSAAAIVLPGGIGTLTELMVAWNLAYVAGFSGEQPKPLLTVGEDWKGIVADIRRWTGVAGDLVQTVATVDAAVAEITRSLTPNV